PVRPTDRGVRVSRAAHPWPGGRRRGVRPRRGRRARRRARGPAPRHDRGRHRPGRWCRAVSLTNYLVLATLLFTIGATTVLLRRNGIIVFMGVELMLNATNLALVTFSRIHGNLQGQVFAFFVMVVAAAEVVIGLAIIVSIFRTRRSASVDDVNLLRN